MHSTRRKELLTELFVVVFAVTFALKAWQAGRNAGVGSFTFDLDSSKAGPLPRFCVMPLYPACIDSGEPDRQRRNL